MLYAGVVGYAGPFSRPPGIVFFLVPQIAWIVLLTRSRAGAAIHGAVPLALLTAAQVFRVFVELYLNELWKLGLLPKMMTFHGANFEIVLAASAPVVAVLIARQSISWRVVVGWNVVGLAMLANVVVRGVLTAPGPLQLLADDHVNRAIGLFPYTFIPGLMVMLGVTLHVVSLRGLLHARGFDARRAVRGAAAITVHHGLSIERIAPSGLRPLCRTLTRLSGEESRGADGPRWVDLDRRSSGPERRPCSRLPPLPPVRQLCVAERALDNVTRPSLDGHVRTFTAVCCPDDQIPGRRGRLTGLVRYWRNTAEPSGLIDSCPTADRGVIPCGSSRKTRLDAKRPAD
jgi:hypothetical protein